MNHKIKLFIYLSMSAGLFIANQDIQAQAKKNNGKNIAAKKNALPPKPKAVAVAGDHPKDVKTLEEFRKDLLDASARNQAVMIKCYADWCSICKASKKPYQEVAKSNKDRIKFLQVNADNPGTKDILELLNVQSIPTWVCVKVGGLSKNQMEKIAQALIAL